MKHSRIALGAVLGVSTMITLGCGMYGGGGGGGGTAVDVVGNVDAVLPGETGRDVVVFVYRLKDEETPGDCADPVLPDDDTAFERYVLEDGETGFEIKKSKAGRLVIAFLLDGEGKDSDGRIDPGDPVAVLNDPDCVLEDVPNKYVVDVTDVRINFSIDEDAIGFPEPGRAEAGVLEEGPNEN